MSRRLAGFALLLAVGATALVVPGLVGRYLPGTAVAAPDPPPPAVGDCVNMPFADNQRTDFTLGSGTALIMSTASFGSCTGSIYGEVTGIYLTRSGSEPTMSEYLHAVDNCSTDGENYLGVGAALDASPARRDTEVAWEPTLGTAVAAVGPTTWERSVGSSWVACVIGAADGQAYRHSARDSLKTTGLPWDVQTCWTGRPQNQTFRSCRQAHHSQLLGTSIVNPLSSVTDAALAQSCTDFAAAMLGTADPTARKSLAVLVVKDSVTLAYVSCTLSAAADRTLIGSVISLGDADPTFTR